MTNDTTTLNGSLMEVGETMATNITDKGVNASASDGLTTLAEKINNINNIVYYNNGSKADLQIQYFSSGASITTDGNMVIITGTTSSERKIVCPTKYFKSTDNVIFDFELAGQGAVQDIAFNISRSDGYSQGWFSGSIGTEGIGYTWRGTNGTSGTIAHTPAVGDKFRFERINNYTNLYINGLLKFSQQITGINDYQLGFYTNNGRTQKIKNLKIMVKV